MPKVVYVPFAVVQKHIYSPQEKIPVYLLTIVMRLG